VLSRGFDAFRMAALGALAGVPAFLMIIAAAPLGSPLLFGLGTLLIGFGGGLFGHGTLTATMNHAPPDQRGLALGAWGAVQATAAGCGIALGAIIRDTVAAFSGGGTVLPYLSVYGLEVILLIITIVVAFQLVASRGTSSPRSAHVR
jgi:BCD family chlorophyll transporter-like MFS transporter